jgi:hypothetical protein
MSGGTGGMAHRVPTCKKLPRPPHILLWAWGCMVLQHTVGRNLYHRQKPLVLKALQVILCDLGRGPVLFHHGLREKEKQYSLNPRNPPFSFFFSLFFSIFHFNRRKGAEEGTTDCAREYGGAQGQPFAFITPRCHN